MYSYIKGELVHVNENALLGKNITVEANNIGYQINTNDKTIIKLGEIGQEVKLYVTLIHREDSMALWGFASRDERDLFNILLSVSGVGAKAAMLLLNGLTPSDLIGAVIRSDTKSIVKIKGIGPKIAQRIILELKDKMTNWRDIQPSKMDIPEISENMSKEGYLEAESVLLSLGYTEDECKVSLSNALSTAENQEDAEELLRLALQWLSTI
ncbi:MAG: Holliday junction branch migration protein RuvA [bacterium]